MGSRTKTQGRGVHPALAGRRDLLAFLDRITQQTASIRYAVYVKPLGNGLHRVKNFCNEQEYTVGTAIPDLSYRPGVTVQLSSNAGGEGEIIVGGPPPGRGGAFAAAEEFRGAVYTIKKPSGCPLAITGKSYLGIFIDYGAEELHAWNYLDGAYQSVAGPVVSFAGIVNFPAGAAMQRIHSQGDKVVFNRATIDGDTSTAVVTWNVAAGTLNVCDTTLPSGDNTDILWPGGVSVFFAEQPTGEIQLYQVSIGATGTLNLAAAAVGDRFIDGTGELFTTQVACTAGGADFQLPAFVFSDPAAVAVPYFAGSWNPGMGRQLASGTEDPGSNGPGYPVTGNRAARLTYFPDFTNTVALLPAAPGSPEVPIFGNGDYELPSDMFLQVSPDKEDLILYPVVLTGEPATNRPLLRLHIPSSLPIPTGCTLPRFEVEPSAVNGEVPQTMLPRN